MIKRAKKPKTRATVADVAKAAGVSVATVSRSFSAPNTVSEEARRKVFEMSQLLDYMPNPAAQALRSRKTYLVGAVIPTLDYAIYARLVNIFQERLRKSGHFVVVATSGFDNSVAVTQARKLVERGAEALLFVGKIQDKEFTRYLADRKIPAVSTYTFGSKSDFPTIGFDNGEAIRQVMSYILGLGHSDIVFFSGPLLGNDRQQTRIAAFREEMEEADLDASGRIYECEYSIGRGADATRAALAEHPGLTAIICSSDVLAFGAVVECRKQGLAVPGRISITGFDDHDYSAALDPPLSTIGVPYREMGEGAADALVGALNGNVNFKSVLLHTNFILRHSSARPPKSGLKNGGAESAVGKS